MIRGFTDARSPLAAPLDAQIAACGKLVKAAREAGVPVVFTTTAYDVEAREAEAFFRKVPSLRVLAQGSEWVELDPRLQRLPQDLVLVKKFASAFFGTHLASQLQGRDTLIVAGCTTSGCVRASVVDAMQHGFRTIVPRECVGDRSPQQHEANLIDMDGKYADVEPLAKVLRYLRSRAQ